MTIHEIFTPTFIKVLGVVTFVFLLATFISGLLRKKLIPKMGKKFVTMHMTGGIIVVGLTVIHFLLSVFLYPWLW